ncbi:MAG TPA: hypothetical protein VH562_00400 [Nitrosopumilaceae archaeon]|jgi:hypothetical protein
MRDIHTIFTVMKIIDVPNPDRVNRIPDQSVTLFSGQDYSDHGFRIQKIELRLFVEKTDENLGPYSLITSFVDTDKGSIEMIYDEGYRGINPLESVKELLVKNLGISGLILRSIITLESELKAS